MIERAHQAAIEDALDFIETEGAVHPRGHQRRPPGRRPRPGRHRVHPPRLPRRRPRPAHPRRGRQQGADPRRQVARHRRPAAATRPRSPPPRPTTPRSSGTWRRARGAVRGAPERRRPQAAGARDRRRRPRPERPVLQAPASASRPAARSSPPTFQAHPRPPADPGRDACSWPSRRPWRPARPSTSRARWPSSARPGTARQSRCSARRAAAAADGPRRAATTAALEPPPTADAAWFARTTDRIVATMEGGRATWQYWHVYAEAQRQVRAAHVPTDQVAQVVDLLVSEVLDGRSVSIARPLDPITEPAQLRRVDGSSVYAQGGADLFTSSQGAGRRAAPGRRRWPSATGSPCRVLRRAGAAGVHRERRHPQRRPGHAGAPDGHLRGTAAAGDRTRRVRQDHRDAGAGQRLDRRRRHGRRARPVSCRRRRAAMSMGSQIDTQTDTLAKLTHALSTGDRCPSRLGGRHRLLHTRRDRRGRDGRHPVPGRRGARSSSSVAAASRLIGDDQQLAAIGAGGVLRDIRATARRAAARRAGAVPRPGRGRRLARPARRATPKRSASTSTTTGSTSATWPP